MKKITALLMVLIMAFTCFSVFAGGSKESASADVDYSTYSLADLKKAITTKVSGKLTVATSPDYAPYEFYAVNADGSLELAGFDMALAKYVADFLGLELDVIPMDFDGVIAEVGMGNVDAGVAGLSPSPDRADAMEFSTIYYAGTQAFICLAENASKFATLADTNKAEYKIGAQVGSIQVGLAEENSPNADIVQLAKVTDIIAEVLNGKLDGAYVELAVAESYAKNYPELKAALDVPYESEGNVVGIKKGNLALLEGVNRAIDQALSDGSMADFVASASEQASGEIYEGLID
ncbi:MAG: transporter substrate-binding domain-containing protein [Sphaerochaetaceae bacterium]|nr:transporter substrate-binding domain-containing protein [Sphaerochaetaceae bacterium]